MMNLHADLDEEVHEWEGTIPLETKKEICDAISDEIDSSSELSRQHGLNPATVRSWMCRVNKGQRLHAQGGRPRLVDKLLVEQCQNFLYDSPNLSDDELKEYVREEYHKQKARDYQPHSEEDNDSTPSFRIKRHTLYRFVRQLRLTEQTFVRHSQDY